MFDVLQENECQFPDANSRPRNKHGFLQPDIGEHVRCPFPRQEKVQLSLGSRRFRDDKELPVDKAHLLTHGQSLVSLCVVLFLTIVEVMPPPKVWVTSVADPPEKSNYVKLMTPAAWGAGEAKLTTGSS